MFLWGERRKEWGVILFTSPHYSSQAYAHGDHDIYGCVLMKELDITSVIFKQKFAVLCQVLSHGRALSVWNLKQTAISIRRVQATSCDVSQFIYFCKTLYTFQTGFPSIIRSSKLHIQRQVFVRPVLLPAASLARLAAGSSTGLTNTW